MSKCSVVIIDNCPNANRLNSFPEQNLSDALDVFKILTLFGLLTFYSYVLDKSFWEHDKESDIFECSTIINLSQFLDSETTSVIFYEFVLINIIQ